MMSKDWRLLPFEAHSAYMNMAIDEAILRERARSVGPNTLRLYGWNPSAVSIGRFQDFRKEVNVDKCRENAVDIVRRITGGGTVYHDFQDEVTYSVVIAKKDLATDSITEVYEKIYGCIARGLKRLGVNADFREGDARTCPNLTVRGKKISGSAQTHKLGLVLQHGTILVDVDLGKMFTFLCIDENSRADVIGIAREKITSLRNELGQKIPLKKVREALIEGFAQGMKTKFIEGNLTADEQNIAEKLYAQKYATAEWNLSGETDLP